MRKLIFARSIPALVVISLLMIPFAPVATATFKTDIDFASARCATDSGTNPGQLYVRLSIYNSMPLDAGQWFRVSARNVTSGSLTPLVYRDQPGARTSLEGWSSLPDGEYTLFAEFYTPIDFYDTGEDGYYTKEFCVRPLHVISGDIVAPPPATTAARTMSFYAIARTYMRRGGRSHVRAAATPGASCTGRIVYANGKSTRFATKTAPSSYYMNWYPRVPKTAAKGRATVRVSCTKAGYTTRKTTIRVVIR